MKLKLVLLCTLALLAGAARADIARIPFPGPRSGSGFSTPGRALDPAQAVPVAMRSARVDIKLGKGEGGQLRATCRASFELEHLGAAGEPVEFMVAFPVTGLPEAFDEERAVQLASFDVSVDGTSPSIVRRSTVYVGYFQGRNYGPVDASVRGKLEGRFGPPTVVAGPTPAARAGIPEDANPPVLKHAGHPAGSSHWRGIVLADESAYSCSYLWTQKIAPGKKQHVTVSYTLLLRPQPVRGNTRANADGEPIGNDVLRQLDSDRSYYFFDYVLKSGATWEGPIGRETITLTAENGIALDGAVSFGRKPTRRGDAWVWEIENEKPAEDVIVALPR